MDFCLFGHFGCLNGYWESDTGDVPEPDADLPQKECPQCGKQHDFDYPRCPYCGNDYQAKQLK